MAGWARLGLGGEACRGSSRSGSACNGRLGEEMLGPDWCGLERQGHRGRLKLPYLYFHADRCDNEAKTLLVGMMIIMGAGRIEYADWPFAFASSLDKSA